MDKNEIFLEEIKKVDESKLPEIITDHIKKIELINESLKKAEDNKKAIENKVNNTLLAAKTLVTDAKELGKSEEKLHYLFGNTNWKSWTTKKDEINAIKENIEGMVKYERPILKRRLS